MNFINLKELAKIFELSDEALKASMYITQGRAVRIRLTNNKPHLALVPGALTYMLKTNTYIKEFDNISTNISSEYDYSNGNKRATGNKYRDFTPAWQDLQDFPFLKDTQDD